MKSLTRRGNYWRNCCPQVSPLSVASIIAQRLRLPQLMNLFCVRKKKRCKAQRRLAKPHIRLETQDAFDRDSSAIIVVSQYIKILSSKVRQGWERTNSNKALICRVTPHCRSTRQGRDGTFKFRNVRMLVKKNGGSSGAATLKACKSIACPSSSISSKHYQDFITFAPDKKSTRVLLHARDLPHVSHRLAHADSVFSLPLYIEREKHSVSVTRI